MKSPGHIVKLLLSVVLFCTASLPVQARDYAEIAAEIASARGNIESAGKSISESAQSVRQAIDAIKSAEHFEGPHWGKLEQAVQNWATTIEQQGRTIDSNARAIFALDARSAVYLQEPEYYGGDLRSLRDQMKQIRSDLEASITRAQQAKERQKVVKKAVAQDLTEGAINLTLNTAADLLSIPTSLEDAGGAAVLKAAEMAGKWFAKPLDLANTGVKFVVGFYYLADESKSGARALKSADEVSAFADEFINRTRADAASAQQGVDIVTRLWQAGDDARSKFNQTQSGWRQASESAAKKQAQESNEAFDAELAKPAPKVGASTYWPAPQTSPIEASEYEPEVERILRELRSAAMAATDGGSPLAYHLLKEGHLNRLANQMTAAKAKSDTTGAALNQAARSYYAIYHAAWDRYRACNCSGLGYDATNRCWRSCSAALSSATTQALAIVVPPATAHSLSVREITRLNQVISLVQYHGRDLDYMIDTASQAARSRYTMLWAEHQRNFEEAGQALYVSLAAVPTPSTLDYYRQQPAWIASDMGMWLQDPAGMRNRVLDTAARLREAGLNAKKGIADYQKQLPQALLVAQKAQTELTQFLTKSGPLFVFGSYYTGDTQASVDGSLAAYQKQATDTFQVHPVDYLTAAGSFPYESTAQNVEQWLGELDNLTGQLDIFNFRLSNANAALHQASQALTHQAAYAQRGESTQAEPVPMFVLKEMTTGPWAGFAQAVKSLPLQELGLKLAEDPSATPRRRLLMIQSVFLNKVHEQMRDYAAAAQRSGGFALVEPQIYDQLSKFWQTLKPLYAQHETIAAPQRQQMTEASLLLPNESGLHKAYNAIPESRRQWVQQRYYRYREESNWLRSYSGQKLDALTTIADPQRNNVMAALQTLIEGYPAAKLMWEQRQAEARALYERQMEEYRLRQAAEDKVHRQQEEQAKQAAQTELSSVQKLYQDFASAYQARNLRGLLRYMTDDWKAADGSDLRDLEDILDSSFRVFDRVSFIISGLNIQPEGTGRYNASYSTTIIGYISQMNIKHQETAQVQDTVVLTPGGPKIQATKGGNIWIKQ